MTSTAAPTPVVTRFGTVDTCGRTVSGDGGACVVAGGVVVCGECAGRLPDRHSRYRLAVPTLLDLYCGWTWGGR